VSVGYADSLRPSPDLPVPWKGAPHTVFIGADPSGHQYDGGAIKLDNTTSAPISVTGVTVYFPNHNMNPQTYNLWGSFEIPANSSAILAETNGNNFDVSDYGINGIVCGNMAGRDSNPPRIMLKVSDAITTTLADTGHVLDTGGFDPGLACAANNESLQWHAIGTGGATASSGNLTLEPLSATVGTSATTTLVARLSDAAGVLPLFNAQVDFNVVSGPNAGQAGHVLTDADGVARFSYTSTVTGTDTVQASITNISNGTFYSNPATVVWAAPPPASAGSLTLDPIDSVTATISGLQPFTVTALDGSGNAMPNLSVTLAITGANAATFTKTTNARGQAAFAYSGKTTGLDSVQALATADGSALFSGVATVRWGLPPGALAINAGGVAGGFQADTDYTGGWYFFAPSTHRIDTSGVATNNPAPQAVYQTARCGNFSYTFPHLTPGAPYTVRLHFAEAFPATSCPYSNNGQPVATVGQRVFDVALNGTTFLHNFDIVATAGAPYKAIIEQAALPADSNGTIVVQATSTVGQAIINGVELIPGRSGLPTVTLSPTGTVTNTVNMGQVFTATVRDASDAPIGGATVSLRVMGANGATAGQPSAVTDATGVATLVYTGTVTGLDTVSALARVGRAQVLGADTTSVYWQLPPGDVAIDSGDPAAGDFVADTDVSGGSTNSRGDHVDTSGVTDPAPQAVYQTVRYGNFSYVVPNLTPGGTYRVRLHFAELFDNGPGQRLFNVAINGAQVLTNFDVYSAAGGFERALVEEYTTTADANGQITVQYTTLRDQAKSSGIEVIPVTPAPTLALSPSSPLTHTISASQAFTATLRDAGGHPLAGSPVTLTINGANSQVITGTTDAQGQAAFVYTGTLTGLDSVGAFAVVGGATVVASGTTGYWQMPTGDVAINGGGGAVGDFVADTDVVGGGQSGDGNAIDTSGVVDPAPQAVYQSFHYDGAIFSYHVPNLTPGAAYTVRLHFSERDSNGPGQRLFNVALNGAQVLTNFDVFATAGGQNRAVIEPFNAQADVSGTIGLTFTAVQNYAFVNGIEIIPQPQPSPSLTLSPSGTVNNTIYHQQAITATARDGGGQPLANLPVALAIRGPNAPNDRVLHGVTDAQGQARFTYVGTSSGTDMAHAATAYLPAVGTYLTSDTLAVRWVQMPGYVAINAGGPQVSDFITDTDVSGGGQAGGYCCTIDTSGALNPAPQGVYQTFHYDFNGFSYTIPNLTPNAPYLVRLHFADRDHNTPGQRFMDVSINSIPVLTNFDVAAAASGQNRAVVEQFAAQADNNGAIAIAFHAVQNYAFVNAIEVIPGAFVSAPTPTQTSTPGPTSTPTQTNTPGPTSTPGSPTATIPPTINPQETVQANITSPAQTNTGGDPQVSGLVPVTGTADVLNGSGLQSYVVSYAPQNSTGNQSFTTAFSGTGPVDNGLLGHFDTTALPNGLYTLQLVVTANDGQTAVSAVNVAVTGQLKIGNLSFTVTDLAVPVLGIPIQIDRTYDNFRRSGGDFGVDWTLGLHTVDVQQDTCTARGRARRWRG